MAILEKIYNYTYKEFVVVPIITANAINDLLQTIFPIAIEAILIGIVVPHGWRLYKNRRRGINVQSPMITVCVQQSASLKLTNILDMPDQYFSALLYFR